MSIDYTFRMLSGSSLILSSLVFSTYLHPVWQYYIHFLFAPSLFFFVYTVVTSTITIILLLLRVEVRKLIVFNILTGT